MSSCHRLWRTQGQEFYVRSDEESIGLYFSSSEAETLAILHESANLVA
jgi:hypothetical protein